MARWVRVAAATDHPPGSVAELVVEDRIVALYNVDGQFYALDGICPHQGGPLGQGMLDGCIVTCPWHGWQYDVRNGQHQANAHLVHAGFPVRSEDDCLYIDLEPDTPVS